VLDTNLLLVSEVNRVRGELARVLASLQGSTPYKVAYCWLNPVSTTLADLADIPNRRANADTSIENLTPLKFIEARFLDTELIVIVWVELPDGSNRVVYGDSQDYFAEFNRQRGVAERLGFQPLDAVPGGPSTRELGARKKAVGMTAEALYYS
jgi:hypothetical protein